MNIVCLEAARALPNVPVWIAEHSDPRHQRLGSIWEAWRQRSYPRCTGCVALTDSIADHLGSLIPRERIRVIPAAIANRTAKTDPTLWSQNDATAKKNSIVAVQGRASANPDGDGLRSLLFVGRLSPEKNLTLLLEAWRIVAQRLPDWQLLLVGDGPERTKLQQTAKSLPRVHFLGWCSQPDGYYQAADLYVLCSRYEGFPVALLEALSYGVPAVATRCSEALDQLVGTSQPGLRLVDSAPEALAVAIVKLAGDPSLRQQMSHAAKAVACNFTWDRIGPLWDAVLGQP
jgi:glycosyltransferase involved in cell wall biosynthesis